jgi:transposase
MEALKVRLKPWQSRQLRELRDRTHSPRVGKRAVCLLMSAAGEPAGHIARVTGLSRDSITDIRQRWRRKGMRSLRDRPHPGRPPRADRRYRRELRRALRRGPLACGYAFTLWSIARLRAHLQERTGVSVSRDWLRCLVHREGFVFGRPKHTLKNKRDPYQYQRARRRLDRLKKGPCQRTRPMSCGTPTPAGSACCPI